MTSTASASPPTPLRVGLIGLGSMGAPMARRVLAAGFALGITARPASADRARAAVPGAVWHDSPRVLALASDVLLLMVPDLPQIEELLSGDESVPVDGTGPLLVVCSSVSPEGLRALARQHPRLRLIDAPVSGGTEGAEAGTLSIMVGGEEDDVARALPVLAACGTALHLGPLGAGEVAKACNQLIVAATMTAIAEAAVIAERSGLDLGALLELLQGGYAGSRVLETKRAALVARDYRPTGVASYMVKDLRAAADEAEATGTAAPVLATVADVFRELTEAGLGDQDLSVVHRFVAERP
ncbi:NAD(P)-dependent oxidoreductase [Rathayibacter festucae]|uniref:NAD(P)-dependent oxidoreductase n=1 Tax=Rathayibacter festucae TaxID=110937 RepID=UPI001FB4C88D|nr:NAD(P)-dependent oxidoreductase [Rathayibacter festucae]MCJ1698125.1 NAD(P)-dependent oxidoreductase [Rathayibacter festucae]